MPRFNEDDIVRIRQSLADGVSMPDVARREGTSRHYIRAIKENLVWKGVGVDVSTPKDGIPSIRQLNRQLLKVGRRICSTCGGNFDISNFYRHGKWLSGRCKRCEKRNSAKRQREIYYPQKRYQDKARERMRKFRRDHPGYNARKMKEQHARQKAKRFAGIIRSHSPAKLKRLSQEQRDYVLRELGKGRKQRSLALELGVNEATISNVNTGRTGSWARKQSKKNQLA